MQPTANGSLSRQQIAVAALIPLIYTLWGILSSHAPRLHLLPYAFVAGTLLAYGAGAILLLLSVKDGRLVHYDTPSKTRAAFADPSQWQQGREWLKGTKEYRKKSIYPESPEVSEGIDAILQGIYRDVVTVWYSNISTTPSFINEIDRAVKGALQTVRVRLESQDLVEMGVSRLVPIVTGHLKNFNDAEQLVRGKKLNRSVTESEELDLAIASKYRDGALHPAVSLAYSDTNLAQQEYVRHLMDRLLPRLLPPFILQSKATAVLIREIVSCAILVPVMQLLSDPDTWNQLVEAYGRTLLQDRKTVQKLRKALDEHASPPPKSETTRNFPTLMPRDDERKFERFIKAIRQCNSLSEARRFRGEVASQLEKASSQQVDQVFTRRLETGKRLLDQKVGMLSAVGSSSEASKSSEGASDRQSRSAQTSIQDVLYNASGLSYFMEYMDRQKLMTLIQFYIVVDGFRNPLEDDIIEGLKVAESSHQWTESERQDIAQISDTYLPRLELRIPQEMRDIVNTFLKAGKNATPIQYQRARSAVLRAQSHVLDMMKENHFPGFRRSDLWYKFLSLGEVGTRQSTSRPRPPRNASAVSSRDSGDESKAHPSMSRSTTLPALAAANLFKRNAFSSTNLASLDAKFEDEPRRSLDKPAAPSPLFDDDVEPEAMGQSIASLDDDDLTPTRRERDEGQVVEAMQTALDDIMTNDAAEEPQDLLEVSDNPQMGLAFDNAAIPHIPIEAFRSDSPTLSEQTPDRQTEAVFGKNAATPLGLTGGSRTNSPASERGGKPNLASLGLVSRTSRIGVFHDNDLFGDEEKFLEDELEQLEEPPDEKADDDAIKEAAPGDLGLAEAISVLTIDIDKLASQENVVDALNRKAELTNNVAELRILGKSKASLQREIRRKELQRQQYIVQESDNSLYGRASVEIQSVVVGKESDGQEFALYVVEVRRQAGENMPAVSWAVARRYSEFHELHQHLREHYADVRQLDFPRRRLMMKLQRDFLHKRRTSLQAYLRQLLRLPDVCRSRDLRAFLSQRAITSTEHNDNSDASRADIVTRLYNSVTDGMDDFLGNIPVLDQLTVAGQNLITAATAQYYNPIPTSTSGLIPASVTLQDAGGSLSQAREAQEELDAFDAQAGSSSPQPFVKPISDLFLETFELNRGQNWLRSRAVVVVLHQLLGGTVERKVREVARSLVSDLSLVRYIAMAKGIIWDADMQNLKLGKGEQRGVAVRNKSRKEASVVLGALVPELAGNVVGRQNAQAAARRIIAAANNERLNAHLAFRMLDELVLILFPDI